MSVPDPDPCVLVAQENIKPLYCDSRYYKILAGGNGQGGVGCGGSE